MFVADALRPSGRTWLNLTTRIVLFGPSAFAKPAVGIEHPRADCASGWIPAYHLSAFQIVHTWSRHLERIGQECLVLRPRNRGHIVCFRTVVNPFPDQPRQLLKLRTCSRDFGYFDFANCIKLPLALLLHVHSEIRRFAGRFRWVDDANRAFLDGHVRRYEANDRIDDSNAHALSSLNKDCISFSIACRPWKRCPDGLIHSPELLQCEATALASPRL